MPIQVDEFEVYTVNNSARGVGMFVKIQIFVNYQNIMKVEIFLEFIFKITIVSFHLLSK